MALPTSPTSNSSWLQDMDTSRLLQTSRSDFELFEEDDQFVLNVEMPGFDPEEIDVTWNDGVLNIAGEHEDEPRGKRKTYHRRFRFPKTVDDEEITAEYTNGILEVRLPVIEGATTRGKKIEVKG